MSRTRGRALQQITKVTGVEKGILSRKLEKQLARYVAKNPKTTSKTLRNDLTKYGTEASRMTVVMAVDSNGLCGCRTHETPLLIMIILIVLQVVPDIPYAGLEVPFFVNSVIVFCSHIPY